MIRLRWHLISIWWIIFEEGMNRRRREVPFVAIGISSVWCLILPDIECRGAFGSRWPRRRTFQISLFSESVQPISQSLKNPGDIWQHMFILCWIKYTCVTASWLLCLRNDFTKIVFSTFRAKNETTITWHWINFVFEQTKEWVSGQSVTSSFSVENLNSGIIFLAFC